MAINFPNSPINGNTYSYGGTIYTFTKNGTDVGYWKVQLPNNSGIASVQEINDGTEPVKYVTPENLEDSKYNQGNINTWTVVVSNRARVIGTTGRTYLWCPDNLNRGNGATQHEYGIGRSDEEDQLCPIIAGVGSRITEIYINAAAATVKNWDSPVGPTPTIKLELHKISNGSTTWAATIDVQIVTTINWITSGNNLSQDDDQGTPVGFTRALASGLSISLDDGAAYGFKFVADDGLSKINGLGNYSIRITGDTQ